MNVERAGILLAAVVMFLVLGVAITSNITGNLINDTQNAASPVLGLVVLVALVIAGFLVSRALIPEGRFHADTGAQ